MRDLGLARGPRLVRAPQLQRLRANLLLEAAKPVGGEVGVEEDEPVARLARRAQRALRRRVLPAAERDDAQLVRAALALAQPPQLARVGGRVSPGVR